jgi:hypothetical protein
MTSTSYANWMNARWACAAEGNIIQSIRINRNFSVFLYFSTLLLTKTWGQGAG